MEDQLNLLQPDFEHLMNDAKDLIKQLGNLEKKGPVLDLSRRMSGAHARLAVRRKSLRHADTNYFKMKSDLTIIQVWLEETEKALRSGDEHKIKVSCDLGDFRELNLNLPSRQNSYKIDVECPHSLTKVLLTSK